MGKFRDLTGMKFGRLAVLGIHPRRIGQRITWRCRCDCGFLAVAVGERMVSGNTLSCGCLQRGSRARAHRTHGKSWTPEHAIWTAMLARCRNPNTKSFAYYGARGITVCERWLKFENFYIDMAPRPSPKHTIERKNNTLGYYPGNCVWILREAQQRNTRRNAFLTFNGETLCIADWARRLGIKQHTIRDRVHRYNWSVEEALTTPVDTTTRWKFRNGSSIAFGADDGESFKSSKP
jgi:hypothetical protein